MRRPPRWSRTRTRGWAQQKAGGKLGGSVGPGAIEIAKGLRRSRRPGTLIEAVRGTPARNGFYQARQPFKKVCDNYRDDHGYFLPLTHRAGMLEVSSTEILAHLFSKRQPSGRAATNCRSDPGDIQPAELGVPQASRTTTPLSGRPSLGTGPENPRRTLNPPRSNRRIPKELKSHLFFGNHPPKF